MRKYYVYMMRVEERKTGRFLFYTGVTTNILRRYREHLWKIKSDFLKMWHPHSRKELVYVEVVSGKEEAFMRERQIKRMPHADKVGLITSFLNVLDHVDPNFGSPIFHWRERPYLPEKHT